jgi:ferric-dicitrate binding protein FerR (iron transport regulator)
MTDQYDDIDRVAQLLRLAGPREAAPPERAMRVRAAVHEEWRRNTRARSRTITVGWSLGALATAALVLLGVRLAVRDSAPGGGPSPVVVATVEATSGPLARRIGDVIRAGGRLDTGIGERAALRLATGAVVRVDSGTRVELTSTTALVLEEGAVYVDAGGAGDPIAVRTRLGVVRDVGTRFEVRVSGSALRVRVRDGLVRLTRDGVSHDARAGDELTLDTAGRLVRGAVPLFGAEWAWAAALAVPFELEGRSLREFLDWITAEQGWQLRFVDAAVEAKAATATLHGDIRGFTPEEALAAVLPTAGVEHQLEEGVLTVRLTGSPAN